MKTYYGPGILATEEIAGKLLFLFHSSVDKVQSGTKLGNGHVLGVM